MEIGHPVDLLAELKLISTGPTQYYQRGSREKAIDAFKDTS